MSPKCFHRLSAYKTVTSAEGIFEKQQQQQQSIHTYMTTTTITAPTILADAIGSSDKASCFFPASLQSPQHNLSTSNSAPTPHPPRQSLTHHANRTSHATGTAPVIQDGSVTLAESGAIIDYLLAKHASRGQLQVAPSAPNFAAYVFWHRWSSGSLMPATALPLYYRKAGLPVDGPAMRMAYDMLAQQLRLLDQRLREAKWLAGDDFTAADVYAVFSVSTMRVFAQFGLEGYEGILRWLGDVALRPAFRAMIEKGEAGEQRGGAMPMVYSEVPKPMW
ncbi:uncharacterized protein K452DRAFT_313116 [Aplosporella prunicola CBS 121167]|uniref:GST C-terminal domain-containing protein n=1 Tax=Aplosporella prunicola CBS 121167 TaxID=1176127 RepID=A0A6A6B0C7_9PEZI|nr:uncharacterized protein K452DRAFT_313116 [Aplosporella prunicola CBS 121167]KAF2136487.1 hypothetical protein K452DRAFT_313116 [Aplosporella prunicola CBS 121167]